MLMKSFAILFSGATLLLASASLSLAETRCGWLENPTPGNYWLIDKDNTWTIMAQGGYEADGVDMIGDISASDYVNTNGNYGYACACMDVMTEAESSRITMIHSFRQLRVSKCLNDKALPPPPGQ
jgi:hypothetical protein